MKSKTFSFPFSKIFILIIFIVASGCDKSQDKLTYAGNIVIGTPSYVSLLKEYKINNKLSFSIDSISDYRCPQDVQCIWSGDVDLLFNINQNGVKTDTLIHFLTRGNNPFDLAGYKWQVLEVTPWLLQHQIPETVDYQIEVLIK